MARIMVSRLADLNWAAFEALYRQMESDAVRVLSETGANLERLETRRMADMRYWGQGSEIVVDLPPGPFSPRSAPDIVHAFEETYRRLFSRIPPEASVQMVNLRVSVSAPVDGAQMRITADQTQGQSAFKETRPVYFAEADGFIETAVYDRYRIKAGETVEGPAVFEENESTLVIGPGAVCQAQPDGSLVVTLPEDGG